MATSTRTSLLVAAASKDRFSDSVLACSTTPVALRKCDVLNAAKLGTAPTPSGRAVESLEPRRLTARG